MTNSEDQPRPRRVSITKLQRDSAAVVELINLCQTVTADGHLVNEEVDALKAWLTAHSGLDLPASEFLRQTIGQILADGLVTASERRQLYMAIERVLPPDLREDVKGVRVKQEELAREAERERKERVAALGREERARNAPVDQWDFMVAGVRYEGRDRIVAKYAQRGERVIVGRDPANPFSTNACPIYLETGHQIGFVPEDFAVSVAPLLDSGHRQQAIIKKILGCSDCLIPVVVLDLFRPDAKAGDVVSPDFVPRPPDTSPVLTQPIGGTSPAKTGCASVLAVAVLGAIALIA